MPRRIVVEFPEDRRFAGRLHLEDENGRTIAGPFPALGKADNQTASAHQNPNRDATQPYGDTPLGTYQVDGFRQPENADDAHRHGPFNRIQMTPTGGQAQVAAQNGRTGLQIHGGFLNPNGTYRPTNGCIRLSDQDMATLLQAIISAGSPPNRCESIPTTVAVMLLAGPDAGEEEGDPPPTNTPLLPMPVLPSPPVTPIPPQPQPQPQPQPPPHDLASHDREVHDRESHDRDPHDLTPHDLTPHDLTPHDLTPHDLTPHDLEPHDLDIGPPP